MGLYLEQTDSKKSKRIVQSIVQQKYYTMEMGKSKDNGMEQKEIIGKKLKFFRLDNMQTIKGQDFGDIRIEIKIIQTILLSKFRKLACGQIQVLIILIRIKVTYLGEQNKDKKSRGWKIYNNNSVIRGGQYDRMGQIIGLIYLKISTKRVKSLLVGLCKWQTIGKMGYLFQRQE
ncbi:unnamed protein product [Paramecium primaurelia]|uniref:Uncharacterized protein n=1 Tax=Paramecium primaurelia TaxID=5886 RepID=A0A8S1QMX7_PARPR|nr:unnamed protein product [Paramecium primaurelia]CAD8116584.1 unnamed protein product [Paramecium primaurelia]